LSKRSRDRVKGVLPSDGLRPEEPKIEAQKADSDGMVLGEGQPQAAKGLGGAVTSPGVVLAEPPPLNNFLVF